MQRSYRQHWGRYTDELAGCFEAAGSPTPNEIVRVSSELNSLGISLSLREVDEWLPDSSGMHELPRDYDSCRELFKTLREIAKRNGEPIKIPYWGDAWGIYRDATHNLARQVRDEWRLLDAARLSEYVTETHSSRRRRHRNSSDAYKVIEAVNSLKYRASVPEFRVSDIAPYVDGLNAAEVSEFLGILVEMGELSRGEFGRHTVYAVHVESVGPSAALKEAGDRRARSQLIYGDELRLDVILAVHRKSGGSQHRQFDVEEIHSEINSASPVPLHSIRESILTMVALGDLQSKYSEGNPGYRYGTTPKFYLSYGGLLITRGGRYVFVSYVRDDQVVVDRLVSALKSGGLTVWLDRNDIPGGARWKDAIRNAIRNGAAAVACFSTNFSARTTSYMNVELVEMIDELRARPSDAGWFFPVRLDNCSIPDKRIGGGESLADIQSVDLFPDFDAGVSKLIADIVRSTS